MLFILLIKDSVHENDLEMVLERVPNDTPVWDKLPCFVDGVVMVGVELAIDVVAICSSVVVCADGEASKNKHKAKFINQTIQYFTKKW